MGFKRWLYQGGRPNWLARLLNGGWALVHATGVLPNYLVTLEVAGRKSGKVVGLPLVMVVLDGDRYLVSMLGPEANWVRNVEAAGGAAIYRCGRVNRLVRPPVLPFQNVRAAIRFARRRHGRGRRGWRTRPWRRSAPAACAR